MNILFLVTSFLLLFSFLSASLLKNSTAFFQEKNTFCNYLTSKQKLHDKWERYQYQSQKKKKPSLKKVLSTPIRKKTTPHHSHRQRKNLPKIAKWNLGPLLQKDIDTSRLEEKIASLLEELYGHTSFWKEGLASSLVDSLKKKRGEELTSLTDLLPQTKDLRVP